MVLISGTQVKVLVKVFTVRMDQPSNITMVTEFGARKDGDTVRMVRLVCMRMGQKNGG
jgi:hypothetical protein